MKPSARFNSVVTTVTIFVMWGAFVKLLPLLHTLDKRSGSVAALITIISSVAIYRGFAVLLAWALGRFLPLKAIVFGPYFMHGTWVGYFVGHGGDVRLLVEHFEQDLHALVIRGRSFFDNGSTHANWTSEAATVDAERGRLIYTYGCDVMSREVTLQGVAVFQIERPEAKAAATQISGYTADLIDGVRSIASERKISSSLIPLTIALADARKFANERTKSPTAA
jgi:hypothetical protein